MGIRSRIANYLSILALCGMMVSVGPSQVVTEESKEVVEEVFLEQAHPKQKIQKRTKIPKRASNDPITDSDDFWVLAKPYPSARQSKLFILHKSLIFYG